MKRILCLSAALLALGVFAAVPAAAQSYPQRPVTLVVPFPAGGGSDALARLIGRGLEKDLGQAVVVENVPGAGSTIGFNRVANAEPNGYTILWGSSSGLVMAPHLYPRLQYDSFKSFEPIGMVAYSPYVLATGAISPFQTFDQLRAHAKAHPGQLNWASPGVGTSLHLTLLLMLEQMGVQATPIAYAGGAASMVGLLRNDVQFLVDIPSSVLPQVQAGKVRPLAVTTPERLSDLPEVATLAELGLKGFDSRAWFALLAPRGTPADVTGRLASALKRTLADPDALAAMKRTGFVASPSSPEELARRTREEHRSWGQVIQQHKVRIE
ncbi:Bug family tripartite tricarboxylate transporter substrate binding protein [Pseudorhodoferax sp.]|uniref:Bug family tripartite tricarboxylate transporter substrate binding protein n=1 Tax=Pseudorhodoferax sp. TaxID=1993553 RepID=UPI002DD6A2E3|nr:tripartite tricarboxylate transporter substrate binding protein [Pseudorhodoferax sp.]